MQLLKGTLLECVSQAYDLGLGRPDCAIRANGQWRFLYL